ncbi:MAG: hypothetical protein IJ809_02230 [Clostridia bacterium]|nr:hypothetical protein [Clostridia bacterium]
MENNTLIEIDGEVIGIAGGYTEDLNFSGNVLTAISELEIAKINSRFKKECEQTDLVKKTAEINHFKITIY